jgi:hypothetical protein
MPIIVTVLGTPLGWGGYMLLGFRGLLILVTVALVVLAIRWKDHREGLLLVAGSSALTYVFSLFSD